ncbi:DUF4412 domain-containing protein [Portibacter marinus]|uniref:DUF4412 domain-containing protein n=1 Tax=Portibacter marinus TaxID=2898660 RepID=UPI001F311A6F|nr:DUF4412 domain-containing protein [Portibacter marinus]
MNLKSLFPIFFLFCFVVSGQAQIDLSKIARDAKRSVNKRIDRNIDKAIDNTLDETEDAIKGKKRRKRGKNKDKDDDIYYEGDGEAIVVKEVIPNAFNGQFLITRDVSGEGDDESNMYTIAMREYETAIRPLMIKKPHNLIIYNKEEETQTTINNELYNGKALKDWVSLSDVVEDKYAEAERTDDIETIGGYIARKYIVDHKDYEGEIWFTKEIDAEIAVVYSLLELDGLYLDPALGFPLRMSLEYDDDKIVTYNVTDIQEDADPSLFDLSAYQLVDMTDLEAGK